LRRLLDVSAAHFLGQGYEATNLAALGAQAQVGRGTLYRHFGSKEGLFAATLRDLALQVAQAARVPALPDRPDAPGLARFLAAAIGNLGGSPSLDLHRTAISASRREPGLAREVHDTVRAPWLRPLAAWISGLTGLPDAQWLGRQALVLALQGSRLFTMGASLTGAAANAQANRAAQIMLSGYISAMNR
jgi:AcrR family transcriptional regulator